MSDESPVVTAINKVSGTLSGLQKTATEQKEEDRKRKSASGEKDAEIARLTDEVREKESEVRELGSKLRAARREGASAKAAINEKDAVIKDKDAEIGRVSLELRNAKAQNTRLDAEKRVEVTENNRLRVDVARQGTQINRLTADLNRVTAESLDKDTQVDGLNAEVRWQEERYEGCSVCMGPYNGAMQFFGCFHGVCPPCFGTMHAHFITRCPKCREPIGVPVLRTWHVRP